MVSCRFVGGDCATIGEREFDTVGQKAVFSEVGFREVILGRACFITDEDFNKCGFTEEELREHGLSGSRFEPPQSFLDKLGMAQQMHRDLFVRMRSEDSKVMSEVSGTALQEVFA